MNSTFTLATPIFGFFAYSLPPVHADPTTSSWEALLIHETSGGLSIDLSHETIRYLFYTAFLITISAWILTHLTHAYHERRVLVLSLLAYLPLYITALILSKYDKMHSSQCFVSLTIAVLLSVLRLLVVASVSTYMMKALTHRLPVESVFANAPFLLTFYEILAQFPF